MQLIFIEKVKSNREAFAAKVIEVSNKLGIDPNWLMIIMYFESGISHTIVNPDGGATGLIQFMPNTAKSLGTTTTALATMSNVQQLDYVYKYFKPKAGQYGSGEDLYLYTFFPLAVGKPDDWTIQTKNLSAYNIAHQNPVLDLNKDGKITVGEWREALRKNLSKMIKDKAIFNIFFKKKV
ncbi:MAG: transglycosylase SLT domain-containing protein [Bacteroidota bacterium]